MTRNQLDILRAIRRYQRKHGYSPSLRDLGGPLNLSAGATLARIRGLMAKGIITKPDGIPRALVVNLSDEKIFGVEE